MIVHAEQDFAAVLFQIVEPAGDAGSPARLSLDPASAPVELLNVCETSSKRHAIWFERRAGSPVIKVGGFVRAGSAGYAHGVTLANPPLYAAATLAEALAAEGIEVAGRARLTAAQDRQADAPPGQTLCTRRVPLATVLRPMMRRSHNHYAEQIVKTLGAEARGEGSWEAGLGTAAQMLVAIGFSKEEFHLDDGSGLSRANRLSPALLTSLLMHVGRSEFGPTFRSLLAVPGQEGTLRRRLTESPYRESVCAKTGYLDGVGALSGYATTRGGMEVAFSILVNDSHNPVGTYSMRQTVDAICRAIVDHAG